MSLDVSSIIAAIDTVIGGRARPVHLYEPNFSGREWDYVKTCLDTGWVSSGGSFVDGFEQLLAERCGTKFAVAVVNGTAALHVALTLAGVKPDDEVIVPALTFVATANAVAYCGAVPNFVDCERQSLGIDPQKLRRYLQEIVVRDGDAAVNRRSGRRLRAVVPVHVFGHPADLEALADVCAEFGLVMIEDATESLGSSYRGRPCGGFGKAGILSFNGNKIVTTGGGGALVTDDAEWAQRAKHLTTTAKQPHKWEFIHDEIGWNYRLPNLNAALGVAQIEQLDGFLLAKRKLARRYQEAFAGVPGVQFVTEPAGTCSNYWLNAILLNVGGISARDDVLLALHDAGILARPAWRLMHHLAMFRENPRDDLSVAEAIERQLINLPSSVSLAGEAS